MKVIIKGLARTIDGEYDFDGQFTSRDLHDIKKISGVRAGEFEEAFDAKDNDLAIGIAYVVLRHNGTPVPVDALWDAPLGTVRLDFADEEEEVEPAEAADAGPPLQQKTEPGEQSKTAGASGSSGSGSSDAGDPPVKIRPATGSRASGTGLDSAPTTSAA